MARDGYGGLGEDPYANGNSNGYGSQSNGAGEYDPFGDRYGSSSTQAAPAPPPPAVRTAAYMRARTMTESRAEKQLGDVLEHVRTEWPAMIDDDCVPVYLALQLLDTSSVGRAHEYAKFEESHRYLQDSLKAIVHEHHQGFNSSIGTFHKIQASIQASQKRVRVLKESLNQSKASLASTDPEIRKLAAASQSYEEIIHTLSEIEDLRLVPDQLEARISEKRFLTAVNILQKALRRIRAPELDGVGALNELRSYFANQETALTDILTEELHDHLYLKSPYCQERWQNLAKGNGGVSKDKPENAPSIRPFYEVVESMDLSEPMVEDPSRNPEADTFYYIELLVEALNKLGRLEDAVNNIKQRLPVELFSIVNETNSEVDQKHPSSLRGGISGAQGKDVFGIRESGFRADVIDDLLWTLYGKFEAIAEGHRIFHDVVKAIMRREGISSSTSLLGSFRELWNLYQNEIRSLLHNYVTSDADLYQFNSSPRQGPEGGKGGRGEVLFQFSDTDSKSVHMTAEYQELEGIITAAVPGLMSGSRRGADGKKQQKLLGDPSLGRAGSRRITSTSYDNKSGSIATHKSLVEPSVFNMSLLLPPTIGFLQRLKSIVPPSSEIVTSTLTSFLDNFLVNVFLPQLEETLGKLSDSVFDESDAFQQEPSWPSITRRPIFKGSSNFFSLITAFCRMLDTIPHDQALSQLIITQIMRYYDRCFDWFKSLVSRGRDLEHFKLKTSATLATKQSELHEAMQKLWTAEGGETGLLEKEIGLLILYSNEHPLTQQDIIMDRDTISSLCLLYTSMKWLATKIEQLRSITRSEADSNRTSIPRPTNRRWTLLNDGQRSQDFNTQVYLPMTQETVVAFDSIVSSYQELAGTVLLTLHMEMRCHIIHSLSIALSPTTAPYILDRAVAEPDATILSLNADLVSYDETVSHSLPSKEVSFIRTGLGLLVDNFLVTNAGLVQSLNKFGVGRMLLNILVLQQNLKNIEVDVNLARAARYYELFEKGAEAIVKQAKEAQEQDKFTYDELKTMIELCYSEQVASPERGISTVARRQMGEQLLQLSEYMWQS
ncbi:Sec8 exocyst complex component-specific domain-containing protein [Xylogone sp. PMI_703]|nr:Sec8 exocyst complex component-specific domain-containing protein [Xylogone sp. PMI_703]